MTTCFIVSLKLIYVFRFCIEKNYSCVIGQAVQSKDLGKACLEEKRLTHSAFGKNFGDDSVT